jgi:transposase
MIGTACSFDLTDAEWNAIEPWLTKSAPGSPAGPDLRFVINGIFFLLRSGAALHAAPPWSTAESYYAKWRIDGTWERILATLLVTRPARVAAP